MLHIAEGFGQLADFIHAVRRGQFHVKAAGGDGFGLVGQGSQRIQLLGNQRAENPQHEDQANDDQAQDGPYQPVITAENVVFGADDGRAPAGGTERPEKDEALLPVYPELAHATLSVLHSVTQFRDGRIGLLKRLGKDGLIEELGGIRMDEIGTALSYHDAIGMRIGFHLGNGVGQPLQGDIVRNHSAEFFVFVVDRPAVGGNDSGREGIVRGIVHKRLDPRGLVQEFGLEIPVHIEVLVEVVALLDGQNVPIFLPAGINGEKPPPLREIVRLKGDGTAREEGELVHDTPAVDVHGIGRVQMALYHPGKVFRRQFHLVQDDFYALGGIVQDLGGTAERLFKYGVLGLLEQEGQGTQEEDGGKDHGKPAEAGGKRFPQEV